jgi:rhodanese-related sulfurtransferase
MKKFMLVFVSFFLFGCATGAGQDISASVFSAGSYRNASVTQSSKLIAENENVDSLVIVDVRTPEEFNEGHLLGAVNIDYGAADFEEKVNKLDKDKMYLVYCRSGRRSEEAAKIMSNLGFKNVVNMLGGVIEWQKEGNLLVN